MYLVQRHMHHKFIWNHFWIVGTVLLCSNISLITWFIASLVKSLQKFLVKSGYFDNVAGNLPKFLLQVFAREHCHVLFFHVFCHVFARLAIDLSGSLHSCMLGVSCIGPLLFNIACFQGPYSGKYVSKAPYDIHSRIDMATNMHVALTIIGHVSMTNMLPWQPLKPIAMTTIITMLHTGVCIHW